MDTFHRHDDHAPPSSGGYHDYHTATFGRLLELASRHGFVKSVNFSAEDPKHGTIVVDVRDIEGRPHSMRMTYGKNQSLGPMAGRLFFDGGAMHEGATAEHILATVENELRRRNEKVLNRPSTSGPTR